MKKALLVGINDYPGTFNDLMGCVNDVQNMQDLLVSLFGFTKENIVMLTDRDATTINILKALEMLVYGAKAGDQLVFHYSGHGSQVPDTQGDETDKLDEILCPYDLDWKSNVIRDDDLGKIFATLPPEVHMEVFLDSCHSGTGLRGMDTAYRKPRYMPMPAEVMPASDRITERREIKVQRAQVLWAACKSNQYAADAALNGKYGGAFTTFLCNSVRASDPKTSRSGLLRDVRANLKKEGFKQLPQLETDVRLKRKSFLRS